MCNLLLLLFFLFSYHPINTYIFIFNQCVDHFIFFVVGWGGAINLRTNANKKQQKALILEYIYLFILVYVQQIIIDPKPIILNDMIT